MESFDLEIFAWRTTGQNLPEKGFSTGEISQIMS